MAKQKKEPAAQKRPRRSRADASLSVESAETLGRVIGTLQRQLDRAIQRFSDRASNHTPRLHTPDAPARSPRRDTKRPRLADDVAPVRRSATTANGKARSSGSSATRRLAHRVERPK
jgi:hypothetical protein